MQMNCCSVDRELEKKEIWIDKRSLGVTVLVPTAKNLSTLLYFTCSDKILSRLAVLPPLEPSCLFDSSDSFRLGSAPCTHNHGRQKKIINNLNFI